MGHQNELSDNLNHWDYIGRYSEWMYHIYQDYVGRKVFDVGAGVGRMVAYYIERCERIVATDIFQSQVDRMNERFTHNPNFKACKADILQDDLSDYENSFDTVICINVLEHLEDDRQAVLNMKKLLEANGNLIIFVPAFSGLFCAMDANVGHYRRYDRGVLVQIAKECDMEMVEHKYFNAMGILPYWLKGRFKKKEGEGFSSSLNESNSRIYNLATKILEPIEKKFPPKFGISEVIILRKGGESDEAYYSNSLLQ